MNNRNRLYRLALAGTAAALLLTACAAPSGGGKSNTDPSALTKVSVAYAAPSAVFNPLILGAKEGIFKKQGLDVTPQFVEATGATSALLSGDVDFLMAGGGSALTAAAQGADLVYVATTDPVFAFLLVASPDIKTPEDLKGKTIGTTATGSAMDIANREALEHFGLVPDRDVTLVPMGSPDKTATALLSGAIDATMSNPPLLPTLEAKGMHVLYDMTDMPFSNAGITTTRKFADENPKVVQGLVNGLRESILLEKSDKDAAIAAMATFLPVKDPALLEKTWEFFTGKVRTGDIVPRKKDFTAVVKALSSNAAVKNFDLDKLIDPSYAEKAMKETGENG